MLNIILFILLIIVAALIIINIKFSSINNIKYSGGGGSDDETEVKANSETEVKANAKTEVKTNAETEVKTNAEENNLIDSLAIICNTESNIDTQHIYIKNLDKFFLNYFKYFKNYSEIENYDKMLKLFLFLVHLQDNYMFINQLNAILYLDTTIHILNIINTYIIEYYNKI